MYLELAAEAWETKGKPEGAPKFPLKVAEDGRLLLPTLPLFQWLLTKYEESVPVEPLAYLFHEGLADQIASVCHRIRDRDGLSTVALSGGVFQNRLLLRLTKKKLTDIGFTVLLHSLLPPNDGGICLGQAVAAMYHINKT